MHSKKRNDISKILKNNVGAERLVGPVLKLAECDFIRACVR